MLNLQMAFIKSVSSRICFTVSYPFQSKSRKPTLGYQVAGCFVLFSLAVWSLSTYTVLCVEVPTQKPPNLLLDIIRKDLEEFYEDAEAEGLVTGYTDLVTEEVKKSNPELGPFLDLARGMYYIFNSADGINLPVNGRGNEDGDGTFPSTNEDDVLENVVDGFNAAVDLYNGIVEAAGYMNNTPGENGRSDYDDSNALTLLANALTSAENLVRYLPGTVDRATGNLTNPLGTVLAAGENLPRNRETVDPATGNVLGSSETLVAQSVNMLRYPDTVGAAVENLLRYPAATVATVTDSLLRDPAGTVYSAAESVIGSTINGLRYPSTVATSARDLQRYPAVTVASVAENLLRDPVGSVATVAENVIRNSESLVNAADNLVRYPIGTEERATRNVRSTSEFEVAGAANSLSNPAETVISDTGSVLMQPARIVANVLNQVMDPEGSFAAAAADMLENPDGMAATVGAAGKLITDTAKVVDTVARVVTAISTAAPSTKSSTPELNKIIDVSEDSKASEPSEKVINPGSYLDITWPPKTTIWRRQLRNGEYVELEKVPLKSKSMFDKGWFLKFRTPAVDFEFGMDGTGMLYFNREIRPIARIHCPAYNFPEDLPGETYPILVSLNNPSGLMYTSNGERFQKTEFLANSVASYSQPAVQGQAITLKEVVGITDIHVDIEVSFSVCWTFLVDISGNLPWMYDKNYGDGVVPNGVYAKLNILSNGRVIYGSQRMYCHLTEVNMIFNYQLKAFRRKVPINLKLREYEHVLVEYYLDYMFMTFPNTVADRIDMANRYMVFDKLWKQTVDNQKKIMLLEAVSVLKKEDVLDRLEKQLHNEYDRTLQLENEEMIFHVSLYTQNNSPIIGENGELVVFTKRVLVPSLLSLKQAVEKEFIKFLRMITKIDETYVGGGIGRNPNDILSARNSLVGDNGSDDNSVNMLAGDNEDEDGDNEDGDNEDGDNEDGDNEDEDNEDEDNEDEDNEDEDGDNEDGDNEAEDGNNEVENRNNEYRWNILSPKNTATFLSSKNTATVLSPKNTATELERTKVHFLSCGSPDFGNFVPRNKEDFRKRVNKAYDTLVKNYGDNLEEFDWQVPGFKSKSENLKIRWSDLVTSTGVDVDSLSKNVSKGFKVADKRFQMPKFKLHVELDPETSEYEVLLVSPESLQRLNSEAIFSMGHHQSEMDRFLKAQANHVVFEEKESMSDTKGSQPPYNLYAKLLVRDREGSVVYGPTLMHCPYISIPKLPMHLGPLVFEATLRSIEHGEITDDFSRVIKVKHFSFKESDVLFPTAPPNAKECGNVMLGARLLDVDYEDIVDNNALQAYVRNVFAETLGREYDDVKICEVKEGSTLIGFSTPDIKRDKENWDTAVLNGSNPVFNVFQLDNKFPTVFKNSNLEGACLSENSTCWEDSSWEDLSSTPSPIWKSAENNEDASLLWWAWLLIVIGILVVAIVLVVVIVFICRRRRKGFNNLHGVKVSEEEVLPKVG